MSATRVRPPSLPEGNFVTTREASEAVGLSEVAVREAAHAGRIRGVKVGRSMWIDLDSAIAGLVKSVGEPADELSPEAREFVRAIAAAAPTLSSEDKARIRAMLPAVRASR